MKPNSNQSPDNAPLYFECMMCGECCSSWNIPIEGDKARVLLEKDWVKARLTETRRNFTRIHKNLYRLPLTDENVCVFLAEDGRCLVEAHEGLALKPTECQRYPFATVRMPDGSQRHDTSASCKKVAEQLLLAFQPIQPQPASLEKYGEAPEAVEAFPQRVWLKGFRKIDVADYERNQRFLHGLFAGSDADSLALLAQAWRALSQRPEDWPASASGELPPERVLPAKLQRWMMVVFLRKPYKTWNWWELIRGRQYTDSHVFGMPVDLRAQAGVAWNPACNRWVNGFVFNVLSRKVLLARGHSVASLVAMAGVACLLVRWYAATLAWLRGNATIEPADVTAAIRLAERYYTGHQPRFLAFFHARWTTALVGRLLLG